MNSTTAEEPLWDAQDVAAFFKCAPKTIYNRASAGTLPCVRLGGLLRFEPAKIRALVQGAAVPLPSKVVPLKR